jgi:lipopolysaccharide transport system ATP-binding protein
MTLPIIEVEHLSKKYRLGVVGATTLREDLARWTSRIRGNEPEPEKGEFWALRDVSFSVQPGEVVGIIGRNGAGKSTLLKLLSRITEPTSGRAIMRGRVASLLEVGTGFHPELTGRDNIFLNGAILGMKRAEISAKFDEIVAFAEVEKFIDTPVKHYSSGMYVRLAFAVAAHLEPEILIVDEVLAVGDAQFQKKCLGKMGEIARGGRTVLFVSHNLASMLELCDAGILLETGCIVRRGGIEDAVRAYLGGIEHAPALFCEGPLRKVAVRCPEGELEIEAIWQTESPIDLPAFGFVVSDDLGRPVFGSNPRISGSRPLTAPASSAGRVTVRLSSPRLHDGAYSLSAWFGDSHGDMVSHPDCLAFTVDGNSGSRKISHHQIGSVVPVCNWTFCSNP